MNQRLSLYLGSAASLVWAASMLLFYTSGRMPTYLVGRGPFQTQALIAGVGIIIVSLFVILTAGEKEADCGHDHGSDDDHDCDHDHPHDHGCDHDHHHDHDQQPHHHHEQETPFGLAMMLLILVVPVATATVLTPDERTANWYANNGAGSNDVSKARKPTDEQNLSARVARSVATPKTASGDETEPEDASDAYASFTLDDLKAQVDQNANGELMITVPELFYTGGDKVIQDVLTGQGIETVGQVMAEIVNDNGKRLRVFRVFMECCAADSRPLAIPVEFAEGLPQYKEMGWYKITGKMSYREEGGLTVPLLEAETFEKTEEPEDAIMY